MGKLLVAERAELAPVEHGQVDPVPMGVSQDHAATLAPDDHAFQVSGAVEVGAGEVGPMQPGLGQARTFQMGLGQIGALQVGASQVGAPQVSAP